MSKLIIYKSAIKSETDKENIIKFSKELNKYISSLPVSIIEQNNDIDFVDSMSNNRVTWDTDDADVYITESKLYEEAKTNTNVSPVSVVIDDISDMFKISKELFLVNIPNHIENIHYKILPTYWKCQFGMSIRNLDRNLNLLYAAMERHGYRIAAKITRDRNTSNEWVDLIFNPIKQESIREMLEYIDAYIYHYSPNIYDEDIEEFGILPHDGTRIFKYKNRAFYIEYSYRRNQNFIDMMRSVTKQKMKNDPLWNGEYTVYEIKVKKLPKHIQFFWDPNAVHGIFTDKVIEYRYITDITYNYIF